MNEGEVLQVHKSRTQRKDNSTDGEKSEGKAEKMTSNKAFKFLCAFVFLGQNF